jgi:uncharacterized LabA/DUF88 family protein
MKHSSNNIGRTRRSRRSAKTSPNAKVQAQNFAPLQSPHSAPTPAPAQKRRHPRQGRARTPKAPVQTQNFASLQPAKRAHISKSAPHKPRLHQPAKKPHNYAFIDSQNVNRSVRAQGWNLDWKEFRRHLQMKYNVDKALLFIGFIAGNEALYDELKLAGFTVVFKPTVEIHGKDGEVTVKGNVDTDLVLHAMIEQDNYEGAVIASGDGDFHSLAKHLQTRGKLANVMVPDARRYSTLLNDFEDTLVSMSESREELKVKA